MTISTEMVADVSPGANVMEPDAGTKSSPSVAVHGRVSYTTVTARSVLRSSTRGKSKVEFSGDSSALTSMGKYTLGTTLGASSLPHWTQTTAMKRSASTENLGMSLRAF